MNSGSLAIPVLGCFFLLWPGKGPAADAFVDASQARGVSFRSVTGATGKRYLVETMVGGVAWLDYDSDGFLDLYLVQGHRHPETALTGDGGDGQPTNILYRNLRGKRFEDVTAKTGVGDRGYGMGAAVGDYNRDGRPDIYVTNYGRNTLYLNRGDHFLDVTQQAKVEALGWSTSASWADFDGDGWLDLYVTSYLEYDTRRHGACSARLPAGDRKIPAYCNPQHFEGAADVLYRNLGDGTFRDVSKASGISSSRGWLSAKGLGVVASDFDRDGDVDILVANDSVSNTLWRNRGDGSFEDMSLETGFSLNGNGTTEAGMGLCRGDVDGDGTLDYFVTNFSRETNTLYLNSGGWFRDATIEHHLGQPGYLALGFGTILLDFDLDGDLDLYVANGHVLDNVETLHPGENIRHEQEDSLYLNTGRGFFRDVSRESGDCFRRRLVSRGVAAGDYDNDGDLDLLVTHVEGPAVLLENEAGGGKRWVGVRLVSRGNRGVEQNAWVELRAGSIRRVHEVQTDGSYLSAHDPRVVFAQGSLGEGATRSGSGVEIHVSWPGRKDPDIYTGLAWGRYHPLEAKR